MYSGLQRARRQTKALLWCFYFFSISLAACGIGPWLAPREKKKRKKKKKKRQDSGRAVHLSGTLFFFFLNLSNRFPQPHFCLCFHRLPSTELYHRKMGSYKGNLCINTLQCCALLAPPVALARFCSQSCSN